jgi:hypothetical protein
VSKARSLYRLFLSLLPKFLATWGATVAAAIALTLVLRAIGPVRLDFIKDLPSAVFVFIVGGLVPIVSVLVSRASWDGRIWSYGLLVYVVAFLLYFTARWPYALLNWLFPHVGPSWSWAFVLAVTVLTSAFTALGTEFMWMMPQLDGHELRKSVYVAAMLLLVKALFVGAGIEAIRGVTHIEVSTPPPFDLMPAAAQSSVWLAAVIFSMSLFASVAAVWWYLRFRSAARAEEAEGAAS